MAMARARRRPDSSLIADLVQPTEEVAAGFRFSWDLDNVELTDKQLRSGLRMPAADGPAHF